MTARYEELVDKAGIRSLTEVNARNRSVEVEAELVRLRLQAGKSLCEMASSENAGRPESEDVFAGCTGLPEIAASDLSGSTLAAGILHHGGLLVRGLYSPAHLDRLQEVAASQEEANRGNNLPLSCTPYTLFDLLEIYRECGLLAAVTDYLDGEPLLFADRAKLRHYRVENDAYAAIPWHQDVNFFGPRSYGVNCWAAVTACGTGNPGLAIIPTNVERRIGWKEEDGIAPLSYAQSLPKGTFDDLIAEHPPAYPALEPGDALLFDEMTVHRTSSKAWEMAEQIVTVSWFFRASGFPGWGTPLAL